MYFKNKEGKSKSKKWAGVLIGIIILGLIIAGYFMYFQPEKLPTEITESEPLRIGVSPWPGYAHVFIAQEKGFFEKNNVDVELTYEEDFVKSQDMYRRGEIDGVFTLIHDVILFDSEGVDAKIVYVADYSDTGDAIVGKTEFNSLADLKGKTLGFEGFNSFSHIFVLQALEKAGLTEDDVSFEDIPDNYFLAALEDGRVDAGHVGEPFLSQTLEKGYKVLAYGKDIGGIIDLVAFSPEIVEERPEDVKAFVKSMLEARDFIFSNEVEAIRIMAEGNKISEEEMAPGIKEIRYPNLLENVEAMKKTEEDTSVFKTGENIANFYLKKGVISQIPDFDKIIEGSFVNALANE